MYYDRIIIGGGLYGIYAAIQSAIKGYNVLIIEQEYTIFSRATAINQARIHNGMHYPRAYDTAQKCNTYYNRFIKDHKECIYDQYKAVYAISSHDSYVDASHFELMLNKLNIEYNEINPNSYFLSNTITAAYEIDECCFDYIALRQHYLEIMKKHSNRISVIYNYYINSINLQGDIYIIDGKYCSGYILNATYASINQIIQKIERQHIDIKYELCEVALCTITHKYKHTGITVMDGPFFSIMPYGKSKYHSLTTVCHTPHQCCNSILPTFSCQQINSKCSHLNLENCNTCIAKPQSQYNTMQNLAKSFLTSDFNIKYKFSTYAIKPILKSAEQNDARPTIIGKLNEKPYFYSVLSGKISTIYELDSIL